MVPANRTHGAIQAELGSLIRNHLAERSSPCSIVTAPGVISRVQSETNLRIPDLAVTCSGYDTEESALVDPVLLIEDPLSEQSGRDLGQCLGLHDHPQRSRRSSSSKRPRSASSFSAATRTAPGRRNPCPIATGDLMLESIDFHINLAAALSDDAAGGEVMKIIAYPPRS